eukprot:4509-Chlamydomonas_euryale.AAC.2
MPCGTACSNRCVVWDVKLGKYLFLSSHVCFWSRSQIYRDLPHEGYACAERSKTEVIKQLAERCHEGNATVRGPEPRQTNPTPPTGMCASRRASCAAPRALLGLWRCQCFGSMGMTVGWRMRCRLAGWGERRLSTVIWAETGPGDVDRCCPHFTLVCHRASWIAPKGRCA